MSASPADGSPTPGIPSDPEGVVFSAKGGICPQRASRARHRPSNGAVEDDYEPEQRQVGDLGLPWDFREVRIRHDLRGPSSFDIRR